jgi:hypothetical protein
MPGPGPLTGHRPTNAEIGLFPPFHDWLTQAKSEVSVGVRGGHPALLNQPMLVGPGVDMDLVYPGFQTLTLGGKRGRLVIVGPCGPPWTAACRVKTPAPDSLLQHWCLVLEETPVRLLRGQRRRLNAAIQAYLTQDVVTEDTVPTLVVTPEELVFVVKVGEPACPFGARPTQPYGRLPTPCG